MAFCVVALAGGLGSPNVAGGNDVDGENFRIHNRIYVPDQKEPIESTTLFYNGIVYDFVLRPEETIVFSPNRDLFQLLDPKNKRTTEITTGEISKNMTMLHTAAQARADKPLAKFYADPKFAESQDPKTGDVLLTSNYLDYRLKTFPPTNPKAAQDYGRFADWSAQLNAMLYPEGPPPFPRLKVNDVLKQRQELPVEVKLTKKLKKPLVIRAEHSIQPRLSQEDLQRIKEVHVQLVTFEKVKFEKYHERDTQQASADKKTLGSRR
jgi:hypothetical protein